MHCIDYMARDKFIQMHPPDFKKVCIDKNFLSKEDCVMLSNYIIKHSLLNKSLLNSINFESSYSFSIRFNKYSKSEFLKSEHNLKPIYDIFERIKQPNTNAYIFNPLILEGLNIFDTKTNDIGYHYDDTLDLCDDFGKTYLPVCTTILYIEAPDIFIGGTLEMHDFGFFECHCPSILKIKPEIGKRVVFRGDMRHCVRSMYSSECTKRISLVYEQYNIPEDRLKESEFKIRSGSLST